MWYNAYNNIINALIQHKARFNVLRFSHMATKRMTIVHTFNILIVLMNTEAAKCDYMSKLAQLID